MHLKKINHLETISPLPLEIFQFLRIRSTPRNNPTPPPPREDLNRFRNILTPLEKFKLITEKKSISLKTSEPAPSHSLQIF